MGGAGGWARLAPDTVESSCFISLGGQEHSVGAGVVRPTTPRPASAGNCLCGSPSRDDRNYASDTRARGAHGHMTVIEYGTWREAGSARLLPAKLAAEAQSLCEVGAGANPLLPPRPGYLLLDASASELAKVRPE